LVCPAAATTIGEWFISELDRLGFLQYRDPAAAKAEIARLGWPGIFGETGTLFNADAEDLAEGGVPALLTTAEPFLLACGQSVGEVINDFTDDEYTISVRGQIVVIYTPDEQIRSGTEVGLLWGLAAARSFALENRLLVDAGSSERAFAVNGGNDLFVFYFTEELTLIYAHPSASASDGPYGPTEEAPWFGQPHDSGAAISR
jgi:hypothetical protein